jgi:hypothetical protein
MPASFSSPALPGAADRRRSIGLSPLAMPLEVGHRRHSFMPLLPNPDEGEGEGELGTEARRSMPIGAKRGSGFFLAAHTSPPQRA